MALTPEAPKERTYRETTERASYLLTLGRTLREAPQGVQVSFPVSLHHERITYQEVDGVRMKILEQVKDPNAITPRPERLAQAFGLRVTLEDGRQMTFLDLMGDLMDDLIREELLSRVVNRQPASHTVKFGEALLLDVGLSDELPVTGIQWFKDGIELVGWTSPSSLTPAATPTHGGVYKARVATTLGITWTEEAHVLVLPELTITRHPSSCQGVVGEQASFGVIAGGQGPFTYQWFRTEAPIPEATTTAYTTPNLTLADTDVDFWVEVSGPGGTLVSRKARLTVLEVAPAE